MCTISLNMFLFMCVCVCGVVYRPFRVSNITAIDRWSLIFKSTHLQVFPAVRGVFPGQGNTCLVSSLVVTGVFPGHGNTCVHDYTSRLINTCKSTDCYEVFVIVIQQPTIRQRLELKLLWLFMYVSDEVAIVYCNQFPMRL